MFESKTDSLIPRSVSLRGVTYFANISAKTNLSKTILVLRTREIYRDNYFNPRNVVNKSAKDVLVKMCQLYYREIYSVVSELSQYIIIENFHVV